MRLHLVELLGRDNGLAKRRGAEIDEHMFEMAAAQAAAGGSRKPCLMRGFDNLA
ncbi:hypothetical protein [Inquilinus limosus]|uniref:hypothetical protein n=1 Tax=Inquilinus limosus TaxID=171674 RepID=UPI001FDF823E|nr:hypothetical protein [Inquilinus limosus]